MLVIVGWSIGAEVLARVQAVKISARLEYRRDEATDAVRAIHRSVGPHKADKAGPFLVGSCYRQSGVSGLVGGDWFDTFELPKGRVMFVVGDVVGHGVDAMEDMAQLRLASRAFASEGHGPSRILTELDVFTKNATSGRCATMIVAVYDPTDQSLTLASAGHPPPLRRRRSEPTQCLPITPGAPLGILEVGAL